VVWPPMVLNRLALLATAGSSSKSSSSNNAGQSTAGEHVRDCPLHNGVPPVPHHVTDPVGPDWKQQ
jgi:hypothetical protein